MVPSVTDTLVIGLTKLCTNAEAMADRTSETSKKLEQINTSCINQFDNFRKFSNTTDSERPLSTKLWTQSEFFAKLWW